MDDDPDYDALSYSWRKDKAPSYTDSLKHVILHGRHPKFQTKMGRACPIICDGHLLEIQENLYDFLLQFRRKQRGRSLWIDAICIDQGKKRDTKKKAQGGNAAEQSDDEESDEDEETNDQGNNEDKEIQAQKAEKLAQIMIMGRIYEHASSVLVWLGASANRTSNGIWYINLLQSIAVKPGDFDMMESNQEELKKRILAPGMVETMEFEQNDVLQFMKDFIRKYPKLLWGYIGFEEIISRDYFERSWVIQELILAKKVHFFIGRDEIPSGHLIHAINLYTNYINGSIMTTFGDLLGNLLTGKGSLVLPHIMKIQEDRMKGKFISLEECVAICRDRKATEKRDKVFAILGLVQEERLSAIKTTKTKKIFIECTRSLAEQTGWPNILSLAGRLQVGPKDLNLPSWVPDYSLPLQPKPFVSYGCPEFSTASSIAPLFEIHKGKNDRGKTHSALKILAADFDIVEAVGESAEFLSHTRAPHLKGHFLDLVTKMPTRYGPTAELAVDVLIRTLTADLFQDSKITMQVMRDGFCDWLEGNIASIEEIQLSRTRAVLTKWFGSLLWSLSAGDDFEIFKDSDLTLHRAIDDFVRQHGQTSYPRNGVTVALGRSPVRLIHGEVDTSNDPRRVTKLPKTTKSWAQVVAELNAAEPKDPENAEEGPEGNEDLGATSLDIPQDTMAPQDLVSTKNKLTPQDANPLEEGQDLKEAPAPEDTKTPEGAQNSQHPQDEKQIDTTAAAELWSTHRPAYQPEYNYGSPFKSAFNLIYRDRRLFRTKNGYLGIGPRSLRNGDKIMLVAGAGLPFIFRDEEGEGNRLRLIGASFVHGIMYGECLGRSPEPQFKEYFII